MRCLSGPGPHPSRSRLGAVKGDAFLFPSAPEARMAHPGLAVWPLNCGSLRLSIIMDTGACNALQTTLHVQMLGGHAQVLSAPFLHAAGEILEGIGASYRRGTGWDMNGRVVSTCGADRAFPGHFVHRPHLSELRVQEQSHYTHLRREKTSTKARTRWARVTPQTAVSRLNVCSDTCAPRARFACDSSGTV